MAVLAGRVASIGETTGAIYLNFGKNRARDASAVISRKNVPIFLAQGWILRSLVGRQIRIRGLIETNNGPRIEISSPAEIELLGDTPEKLMLQAALAARRRGRAAGAWFAPFLTGPLALAASGCAELERQGQLFSPTAPAPPATGGASRDTVPVDEFVEQFGGVYRAPVTEAYLNRILQRLAAASGGPGQTAYKVTISIRPFQTLMRFLQAIFTSRGGFWRSPMTPRKSRR